MNIFEQKLFLALAFIQSHLVAKRAGSWGWAIVLLTVGINLLLLPLRLSSMRSGGEDAADTASDKGDQGPLQERVTH